MPSSFLSNHSAKKYRQLKFSVYMRLIRGALNVYHIHEWTRTMTSSATKTITYEDCSNDPDLVFTLADLAQTLSASGQMVPVTKAVIRVPRLEANINVLAARVAELNRLGLASLEIYVDGVLLAAEPSLWWERPVRFGESILSTKCIDGSASEPDPVRTPPASAKLTASEKQTASVKSPNFWKDNSAITRTGFRAIAEREDEVDGFVYGYVVSPDTEGGIQASVYVKWDINGNAWDNNCGNPIYLALLDLLTDQMLQDQGWTGSRQPAPFMAAQHAGSTSRYYDARGIPSETAIAERGSNRCKTKYFVVSTQENSSACLLDRYGFSFSGDGIHNAPGNVLSMRFNADVAEAALASTQQAVAAPVVVQDKPLKYDLKTLWEGNARIWTMKGMAVRRIKTLRMTDGEAERLFFEGEIISPYADHSSGVVCSWNEKGELISPVTTLGVFDLFLGPIGHEPQAERLRFTKSIAHLANGLQIYQSPSDAVGENMPITGLTFSPWTDEKNPKRIAMSWDPFGFPVAETIPEKEITNDVYFKYMAYNHGSVWLPTTKQWCYNNPKKT